LAGELKSAFPDGIEVPDDAARSDGSSPEKEEEPKSKKVTGLTEASEDCAVIVFADVDFISDVVAYRSTFFGTTVVDDNASLMLNAIEDLTGSSNLFSIRSRGNFKRPFTVVNDIELEAEEDTAAAAGCLVFGDDAVHDISIACEDVETAAGTKYDGRRIGVVRVVRLKWCLGTCLLRSDIVTYRASGNISQTAD